MAEGHAEASGSRPWAGSPALLARAERFLVSRLGCDPEEARQYLRGLVGPVPGAGADGSDRPGGAADTSDPPPETPPEASAEPSSWAPPESPPEPPPRRRAAAEGRPVVFPRRRGDVGVMRASMTAGPPSPSLTAPEAPDPTGGRPPSPFDPPGPADHRGPSGTAEPPPHAATPSTPSAPPAGSSRTPGPEPVAGDGAGGAAGYGAAAVHDLDDPGFLAFSEQLTAARTPGELARRLHRGLRPSGVRTVLLAVLDDDGPVRLSGAAGDGAPPVDDWTRTPLRHVLPLLRTHPSDRLLWRDDGTGDRTLTWISAPPPGAARPHRPDTRSDPAAAEPACVVCAVWPRTTAPAPGPDRAHAEAVTACGGRRLRDMAAMSAPAGDIGGAWLDSVLGAIPIPAALLSPIRDRRGRVADFSVDRRNARAAEALGRFPGLGAGGRLLETFPGLAPTGVFDAYVRVLETGEPLTQEPFTYEEPFRGVLYPRVLSLHVQRMGGGLLVSWQRLDEQARAAARMSDAERLMNLGWAEWNLVTGEIAWSRRIYDIFDLDPRRGPLPLDRMAAYVDEDDLPAVVRAVAALSERRAAATFEFRTRRAFGRPPRHVNVTAEPVVDALGNLIALRGVVQDVSARRRIEAALRSSRGELERHRRRVAEELQRELLPEWSPDLPGLRVAVRYQPAEDSAQVGGDWYEATTLPDGRVLIAIGDASGHGLRAAARMAQLRNALLGMAFTGADPARMLECLNLVALHGRDESAIATAIVAHFDPAEGTLTWARAGHPAPVLARGRSARQLANAHGAALGVTPDAGYRSITTRLRPGDSVVLYTDGLVERHTERGDDRFRLLLEVAGQCAGADPDHQLRSLLSALDTDPQDDTCVIVLHVRKEA